MNKTPSEWGAHKGNTLLPKDSQNPYKAHSRKDCLYETPLIIHLFFDLSTTSNLLEAPTGAFLENKV